MKTDIKKIKGNRESKYTAKGAEGTRKNGVSEGIRTLGRWGHNPVLYPAELHSPQKTIARPVEYRICKAIHIIENSYSSSTIWPL
jgi:hypothetical protein